MKLLTVSTRLLSDGLCCTRLLSDGLCSNFKRCQVQNKNTGDILKLQKHPFKTQVSLTLENQRTA